MSKESKDDCHQPDVDEQFVEGMLSTIGAVGDGAAAIGLATGNLYLIGGGKALSVTTTLVSAGANYFYYGDTDGAISDLAGLGGSLIPGGGNLMRRGAKYYGPALDFGKNSKGQYVKNWPGRRRAQDSLIQSAQGRAASGATGALLCAF